MLNRKKTKARKEGKTHGALPHHIFKPDFKNNKPAPASILSHSAAHMLDNLVCQYNGFNNGDLSAAPAIMRLYGWRSTGAIHKALTELLARGFIEQTRQGGRNKCSLYALSWQSIDECQGKIDVSETRVPSNLWKPENRHKIDKRFIEQFENKSSEN